MHTCSDVLHHSSYLTVLHFHKQPFLSLRHMSLLPQVHLEETLLQVRLILHLPNNQIHDIGFPVFLPLFLLLFKRLFVTFIHSI